MSGLLVLSRLLSLFLLLALAGPAAAQYGQPEGRKSAESRTKNMVPMIFYVATGEPGACGPGCSTWIAAEGALDREAAERLRAFLAQLGRRKLPIYFHSPGGSMGNALLIGRMLRARRMSAGVARTIPAGCDPKLPREAPCEALKRSGRELAAELSTQRAQCSSACVYALIGAPEREVAPGAMLGVHAVAPGEWVDGFSVRRKEDAITPAQREQLRLHRIRYAEYVVDMGVDRGLFEAAEAFKEDRVRFLSRTEIARFGIDRRDFSESRWLADEGRVLTIVKYASQRRGGEPKLHHGIRLQLACGTGGEIQIHLGRELADADGARDAVALTTAAGDLVFAPTHKPRIGNNDITVESRQVRATAAFLAEAARSETMTLLEAPDASRTSRVIRMSTLGLAPALAQLVRSCEGRHNASDKGELRRSNNH
jgi:hypothetical protein